MSDGDVAIFGLQPSETLSSRPSARLLQCDRPGHGPGDDMRILSLALLASACDSGPAPQAVDYDAACTIAADCAVAEQRGNCGFDCGAQVCLSTEGAEAFLVDQDDYWSNNTCRESGLVGCVPATTPVTCGCTDSVCVEAP